MKLQPEARHNCSVCGEPASYACDRSVLVCLSVRGMDLRRGDQLLSRNVKHLPWLRHRSGLTVRVAETIYDRRLRRNPPRFHALYVLVDVAWKSRGRNTGTGSFITRPRKRFSIERRQRCGQLVCYRHVREAAEGVHYCSHCTAAGES